MAWQSTDGKSCDSYREETGFPKLGIRRRKGRCRSVRLCSGIAVPGRTSLLPLVVCAVLTESCANRPVPRQVSSASFFRVDYEKWSCQQLAEEADLLDDARTTAAENPFENSTDTTAHIAKALDLVRSTGAKKRCEISGPPEGTP